MYRRKSLRQRVYFKTSAGVEITSALASISWLSSNYVGKPVSESDVVNTAVFSVYGNLRNVYQGHYIWTSTSESWLITGAEYRGTVTEFTALLQMISTAFAPCTAAGIISEWAFETSGALTTDSKGLNNLTNINTVAWDSDKPSQIPFTLGSALFASASSEQLRITDASQVQLDITGQMTIAFRFKATSLPGGGARMNFVAKSAASPNLGYEVFLSNAGGNKVQFKLSQDGGVDNNCNGATAVSISIWYSVACVYNGIDARVYLNGSLDANGSQNPLAYTAGFFDNGENFALGARSSSADYFNGRLAHVFIFNQAKSASEVATWHSTDVWP